MTISRIILAAILLWAANAQAQMPLVAAGGVPLSNACASGPSLRQAIFNNSAFSGTTVAVSLSAVNVGDGLRVVVYANTAGAISGISLSDGTNTYSQQAAATSSSTKAAYLFYHVGAPTTSPTLTVTIVGSTFTDGEIWVEDWTVPSSGAVDGTSVGQYNSTSSGNVTPGSITTTVNCDDVWGAFLQTENVTPTVGSGFTLVTSAGAGDLWTEHLQQMTAGAINPNWTSGASSFDNFLFGMAVKR